MIPSLLRTRSLRPILLFMLVYCAIPLSAQVLRGVVLDKADGQPLIGATVVLKGTTTGTITDLDGRFELNAGVDLPFTLVISFVGYAAQEVAVNDLRQEVRVRLGTDQVLLKEAEVIGSRITDKQKQAPLTVESMDVIAIREAPGGDFYESLGTLKGVDMVAASFGFKVINTRGFNSTSPVRSLQLIDGVDNQSPGLNFSLGNFLGASDLDVMRVDVIAGASTAYYGPGAFNGVINMTTKSPWNFQGLSVSAKAGERDLLEGAIRWAEVIKDSKGKDRFAYKLNLFAMRANDWPAENYAATTVSPTSENNPGRYDAVNIYGDENTTVNNNYLRDISERLTYPGLGLYLRPGYRELDLVDYDTHNLKAGLSLHYRLTDGDSVRSPVELIAASNYSTGSTVYQGDNRYRLQDVQFFQHRLEARQEGRWFVRGYVTHEDAGTTYDIFTTGIRLQQAAGPSQDWNTAYANYWAQQIRPLVHAHPEYITQAEAVQLGWGAAQWMAWQDTFLESNTNFLAGLHAMAAAHTDRVDNTSLDPAYVVGTERFQEKFNEITGKRFTEGGSLFYDRSALAHGMGEYRFKPAFAEVVVGASYRAYLPNSAGTIFRDTGNVVIRNQEYGIYLGLEKPLFDQKLRTTMTMRMDKNENFKALFSPAASLVYTRTGRHVVRGSFSSAIRNPTLADQYLYYNVGRALLLGNLEGQFERGRDSLFTVESFNEYRTGLNLSKLDYFNVERIRPEQVRTVELGYRGTIRDKIYVDASAYHSWYTDFIGYVIGLSGRFADGFPVGGIQAYRLAANATSTVRTLGGNVGVNYYLKRTTFGMNYGYNKLVAGQDDPIIPAFNTPLNKFNVSITGHDMRIPFTQRPHMGYGIAWRYVEGFVFEGSPQFTGPISSYDMLDAQVNARYTEWNLTLKIGASNIMGFIPLIKPGIPDGDRLERAFNNNVYTVFGGPLIGRIAYVQLIYDFIKR